MELCGNVYENKGQISSGPRQGENLIEKEVVTGYKRECYWKERWLADGRWPVGGKQGSGLGIQNSGDKYSGRSNAEL